MTVVSACQSTRVNTSMHMSDNIEGMRYQMCTYTTQSTNRQSRKSVGEVDIKYGCLLRYSTEIYMAI